MVRRTTYKEYLGMLALIARCARTYVPRRDQPEDTCKHGLQWWPGCCATENAQ